MPNWAEIGAQIGARSGPRITPQIGLLEQLAVAAELGVADGAGTGAVVSHQVFIRNVHDHPWIDLARSVEILLQRHCWRNG